MPNPAIIVKNLSKSYRLGVIGRQTLQDEVRYWTDRGLLIWVEMKNRGLKMG